MEDDRRTRLLAACWSLAAAAVILLSLRLYCKVWRGRGLWWDDHLLIASWISLSISCSVLSYICSIGFGTRRATISDENLKIISLSTIMVAAFGIMATTLSKTSFAITLYRISTNQWMKYLLIFIIVTINVSMNLVWIFGLVKCTPFAKVIDGSHPGKCWDRQKLLKFQLFAAYYSAILDFMLALLPWQIIMGMSMRRRERLGVAVAMSLGAMRMLYHELKTSHARSKYNRSNPYAGQTGAGATSSDAKRATRQQHSKYGQNSVVIMSNIAWEESQEALRDPEASARSPNLSGVLKTEEVRVEHERLSTVGDEDSIELKPYGVSATAMKEEAGGNRRNSHLSRLRLRGLQWCSSSSPDGVKEGALDTLALGSPSRRPGYSLDGYDQGIQGQAGSVMSLALYEDRPWLSRS
ncbi:conserved hypothetical protein [Verticillium alfalfae VaMs.102]|uniref:Rhodopsin domain-containing protein n=1 Tax=Verticillium alfalfae (strain VaMs.102 / ATCC MYA-4576 / FGSC 10136) TaxID=526221 RepID=C9SSU9_VERA1|nr:conserved hypothetical protein [Verticillium alfalfae VaMs.102]EEY21864.1 conserved hypothetical protein [Verticillium alfalfae VaMs.102]